MNSTKDCKVTSICNEHPGCLSSSTCCFGEWEDGCHNGINCEIWELCKIETDGCRVVVVSEEGEES